MRLLTCEAGGSVTLEEYALSEAPEYAILSHTWGNPNDEVLFKDIVDGTAAQKPAYRKLEFCRKQAALDGLRYFWLDTCCIDKANYTELSEAINSMFRWYQEAKVCYAYLSDVSWEPTPSTSSTWAKAFQRSRYFKRGWTLQELLAPESVQFFSTEGASLGDRKSLENEIHNVTKIPVPALRGSSLVQFPVEQRLSWSHNRETTKEEDIAYCLLGIFGIHIPLIYGEGRTNAMRRLLAEVEKSRGVPPPSSQAGEHPQSNGRISTQRLGTAITEDSHFVIPFGRNEDFVGRAAILADLVERILPEARKDDCQRTVVEGLGGVGKTQIALEAAHSVRDQQPECSVFWAVAMTSVTIENSFRSIGEALGLQGLDSENSDVKGAVKAALEKSTGSWLLIIDNIDDVGLVTGKCLRDYLPFSRRGSILFTTRNHEVAVHLDVSARNILTLDKMDEAGATAMFENVLKKRQLRDIESTNSLLRELTYLPLAVKQASAYMARTGLTTAEYLQHYCASDDIKVELLNADFEDRWRYSRNTSPITKTWLVSFQHLEQSYPGAAEYLKFSCLLAEKDISVSLLPGDDRNSRSLALGVLEGYAFITFREADDSFDIHRLIRLATRNWMTSSSQLQTYSTKVVRHLAKVCSKLQRKNRQMWTRYLPHLEVALQMEKHCADIKARAYLLQYVSQCYDELGMLNEAEPMILQAFELKKRAHGANSVTAMGSMNFLAVILSKQGKVVEAEQIYRETLRIRETLHGLDHPSTLHSMNNLACVLQLQKRYDEAEQVLRKALQIEQTLLGPDQVRLLISMNNLAVLLNEQGKYGEAEKIYRKVMQSSQTLLGFDDPGTLQIMTNYGCLLQRLKRYKEAEQLLQRTLGLRNSVLGSNHPHTRNNKVLLQKLSEEVNGGHLQVDSEKAEDDLSEDSEELDGDGGVRL